MKPQSDLTVSDFSMSDFSTSGLTMPSPMLRRFCQASCPKCKETLFAPTTSEYIDENHVRHVWSCDSCGHEFRTSAKLFAGASQARGAA
jgi:RNase P subunit RPR2